MRPFLLVAALCLLTADAFVCPAAAPAIRRYSEWSASAAQRAAMAPVRPWGLTTRGLARQRRSAAAGRMSAAGGLYDAAISAMGAASWLGGTLLAEGNLEGANSPIFQRIFVGGIVIMLSGVVSAYIVSVLVEKGDLYEELAEELGGANQKELMREEGERARETERAASSSVAARAESMTAADLVSIDDEYAD